MEKESEKEQIDVNALLTDFVRHLKLSQFVGQPYSNKIYLINK